MIFEVNLTILMIRRLIYLNPNGKFVKKSIWNVLIRRFRRVIGYKTIAKSSFLLSKDLGLEEALDGSEKSWTECRHDDVSSGSHILFSLLFNCQNMLP